MNLRSRLGGDRSERFPSGSLFLLGCALLVNGCYPAGVFTTARAIAPGEVEHVAFVEVPVTRVENDVPRDRERFTERGYRTRSNDYAGLFLGYGLRVGLHRRLEAGAQLGLATGELNGKVVLVDGDAFALALAPRASATYYTEDSLAPFVHLRAPLLMTVDLGQRTSVTLRSGLGVARGRTGVSGIGAVGTGGGANYLVSAPTGEVGASVAVRVVPSLAIAAEAYVMTSLEDRSSTGRSFVSGGAGLALLFGRAPRRH